MRVPMLVAAALLGASAVGAQDPCAPHDSDLKVGSRVVFTTPHGHEPDFVLAALNSWANTCRGTSGMPTITSSEPSNGRHVPISRYTMPPEEVAKQDRGDIETNCAVYLEESDTIRIYYRPKEPHEDPDNPNRWKQNCDDVEATRVMEHEIGHAMGLDHAPATAACRNRLMYPTTDYVGPLSKADCEAVAAHPESSEYRPGGGGTPPPIVIGPCAYAPFSNACECSRNEYSIFCDRTCYLQPALPGCDIIFCDAFAPCKRFSVGDPRGGGTFTASAASGAQSYTLQLKGTAIVTISVTNMSRDFNCSITPAPDGRSGQPLPALAEQLPAAQMCSNQAGTMSDSWTGTLSKGTHRISVFPADTSSSGSYTINVTARLPPPPTKTVLDVSETGVSSIKRYRFSLDHKSNVTVSLTGMTQDFDCRMMTAFKNCTNNTGTADDSWSGVLEPGSGHWLQVSPGPSGQTGDYRVVVTATRVVDPPTRPTTPVNPAPTPNPNPTPGTALDCPAIPNFRLLSGHTVNRLFPEATGGTAPYSYSLSGLPSGLSFTSSTRTVSGTAPTVTNDSDYAATYTCTDDDGESDSSAFTITVGTRTTPSAPTLSGWVTVRTHTLSWTKPAQGDPITGYDLQIRNSSAHAWRYPNAGSTLPSSDLPATARSWTVRGPWGLARHYRIRAKNADGDGGWSNIVELETGEEPEDLTLPGVPNFRVPSGHTVSTLFPEASGGTPPYSYSLTGLPPDITFNATTRIASGTFRAVTSETRHTVTYSTSDAGGDSASVSFTVTVEPPPRPDPPGVPASLTGSATQSRPGGAVNMAVSWSAGTGGDPDSYQLDRWNGSSWISIGSYTGTSASTSVTPPTGVTVATMTVRLSATNEGGTSGYRQTTVNVEHDPPRPRSFTGSATQAGPGADVVARLRWSPGSGGAATTSYRVEKYRGSGIGWVHAGTFSSTTTSATLTQGNVPRGHTARTATYRIRAANAIGESGWLGLTVRVTQSSR